MREAMDVEQLNVRTTALCENFWQWRLENFPEFATLVGSHRYDDQLNDLDPGTITRRKNEAKQCLEEVHTLMKLYFQNNFPLPSNVELLALQLDVFITGHHQKAFLCPVNRSDGPHFNIIRLIEHMKTNTIEDYRKIITRLLKLEVQVDQIINLMKEGIRCKVTLHEHSISVVPSQLNVLVKEPFQKSPLAKCFQTRPELITDEDWRAIVRSAKSIIGTRVIPALSRLAEFISNDYMLHTRTNTGVTTIPKGKSFYEACLNYHTSSSLTPREIHNIGLKEVQRIYQRMHDLKNQMNFTGTINDLRNALNKEHYKSEDEMLDQYACVCNRIWKELPKMFITLPKENCQLKPVPKVEQNVSPTAYYKEGDENRAGVFYVNTSNLHERRKFATLALCLHESIPGHHLQSEVFLRKKSNAKFRRFIEGGNYQTIPARFPLYTAFMEGWGLYAEYLGEEMNLYSSTELFGRLCSEMLRATRLVVDTGLHAFSWSKSSAVDYLVKYVGLSTLNASSEVDRYITWPGQACSYKIGEFKILELRNGAAKALGDLFDLREFHDVVLCNGAIPLDILERNVQEYIRFKTDLK